MSDSESRTYCSCGAVYYSSGGRQLHRRRCRQPWISWKQYQELHPAKAAALTARDAELGHVG